jgi:hypothetical protein
VTLRISEGGCGVELVPLAELIKRSKGGSRSRSADVSTYQLYLLGPLHHYHQVLVAFSLEMPFMR